MTKYIVILAGVILTLAFAACRQHVPQTNSQDPENSGHTTPAEPSPESTSGEQSMTPSVEEPEAAAENEESQAPPVAAEAIRTQPADAESKNTTQYGGLTWYTDLDAAIKKAEEENKQILLNFSGSDWCYWCQQLDKEVFSQPAFQQEAPKHFVFVLIDFPSDQSLLSAEQRRENQRLAQHYGVQAFPTILLARSNGKAYAMTGYEEGGPEVYLRHLLKIKNENTPGG